MKLSTAVQICRMDKAIKNLKAVLESVYTLNIHALKTERDILMAENELHFEKILIESCVKQLKEFDEDWQKLLLSSECDEDDVNTYFEKYYDANRFLEIMYDANAQLINTCTNMQFIEIQKSPGKTFDTYATKFVSVIPDIHKIPILEQNTDNKIIETIELVNNNSPM